MNINERVKKYRLLLHLSQDYVAKYLGVNRSTIAKMENGNRKVLAEEVSKLATLFGVSEDTLINGQELSKLESYILHKFD